MPPDTPPSMPDKTIGKFGRLHEDDVELATSSIDTLRTASPSQNLHTISQYDAAKAMVNFQSIDVGAHCETQNQSRKVLKADSG